MTDEQRHDDLPDDTIRDALASAGERPTPEFVASLRATLSDATAGRTTAPVERVEQRPTPRRSVLVAAAGVALVVVGVTVLALRGDDGEVATVPPPSAPTEATAPPSTADHPTTAEQLSDWVGIRLNGLGNGAVNGRYPWFVITSVDGETGAIRMSGNDGCNDWSSRGTIVDGRFEYIDGESDGEDCGPGTFAPFGRVALIVHDDGIDIEAGGIVYPFGPDPVVADAATLIDRRRFIGTSAERPFPFTISFDGPNVVGFDGCGIFGATAEYTATSVGLLDVDAQCSTHATPREGDTVQHVGGNTIRVRRGGETVVDALVSAGEMFTRPTTDGMIGDWAVGWGRVTFEEELVRIGRCETTWDGLDDVVSIASWGDCVTGLFPGDPRAEATLRVVLEGPLVRRNIRPAHIDRNASILDSGLRAVRLERIEELPPSSPRRLFGLADIDGARFDHARLPTVAVLGAGSGILAVGTDGCGEFSLTGETAGSTVTADAVTFGAPCAIDIPTDQRFAPAAGTTITIDGSELTATDELGRTGRYVEVGTHEGALVSDLLDPLAGTGAWGVDGLTVELTGPPGVGVLRVGSCERAWSFGLDDEPTLGAGPLIVDGEPEPITGCAPPDRGHDAAGLLSVLAGTSNGTGAELRLADEESLYLIWDVRIVRLEAQAPLGQAGFVQLS